MATQGVDEKEVENLQMALTEVAEREKRLVHLFTLADISEEAVRDESASLASEKRVIEERLASLKTPKVPSLGRLSQTRLKHIYKPFPSGSIGQRNRSVS